jgi:uncharacterized protein YdeI (YjbR/CyaY-like superfamily)
MAKKKQINFDFTSKVIPLKGAFTYAALPLPDDIINQLTPERQRAKGTINEVPFALAIQYRKDGSRFIMASKVLCKQAKIKIGDIVNVSFQLVDPNVVELPEELEVVLEQDEDALKVWKKFTPGLQRSLAHYVLSVKNIDSRINRSFELANKIKTGKLQVQQNKKK